MSPDPDKLTSSDMLNIVTYIDKIVSLESLIASHAGREPAESISPGEAYLYELRRKLLRAAQTPVQSS